MNIGAAQEAANEILARNEALPVVRVMVLEDGMVRVDTLGDYVVFRADLSTRSSDWDDYRDFYEQFAWAASRLKANSFFPIPEVPQNGVLAWMEERLRPDAIPHALTPCEPDPDFVCPSRFFVWPPLDGYRPFRG